MNLYQSDYTIPSSDCDRYGFWRMNSIMLLMQELGGTHAGLLGWGRGNTLALGAVWVVTRHEMAIRRYPEIAQVVTGMTATGRPRRGIYTRQYLIKDKQGRPLVSGSSLWVLADVNTRQMIDLPQVAQSMPETPGFSLPLGRPGAADELKEGFIKNAAWKPLYTDIDQNGHVNNTRAADWALCFLGEHAQMDKTPVKSLKVSYHREILPDTSLDIRFCLKAPAFSLRCDIGDEPVLRLSGELFSESVRPGE